MPSPRTELRTLKRLLAEADSILSTTKLPENRAERCRVSRSILAGIAKAMGITKEELLK